MIAKDMQLHLELNDRRVSVAWEGVNVRDLTRARNNVIFKAQAIKGRPAFIDPDQLDLWMPRQKTPWVYQGAPLLIGG